MSIIARTRPQVKPARVSPRKPAPFGKGILRSLPTYRTSFTAGDANWAAETFNRPTDAYDLHMDAMATESAMLDSYTRGLLPL